MNYCQNSEKIKKVLLVGLGGVGTVYANLINHNSYVDLRVLVDDERLKKYLETPRKLNGVDCEFNYILPTEKFLPDLIILATKSDGFSDVVRLIKPFVQPYTILMSLSNGITSEDLLEQNYNNNNVIHSFVICHTISRDKNNVTHDGVTNIVWGHKHNDKNIISVIKQFFDDCNIENTLSTNILKDMWKKFCFNCCVNQISALKNYTFAQIREDDDCMELIKKISNEIQSIAEKIGIKGLDLQRYSVEKLYEMLPDAKTSMLQDFENNRIAEVDLFSNVVVQLAEKYSINVPYNKKLYNELMVKYNKRC